MTQSTHREFGKFTTLVALTDEKTALSILPHFDSFKVITGKVGSMDLSKVISSVETAAKRGGISMKMFIVRRMHFIMRFWKHCKV